ncbi:MAG: iron transporter [Flavobacteriaceae bacterium]|nr:MAG: iron transporter [Flavobacteriaceae bacterium]
MLLHKLKSFGPGLLFAGAAIGVSHLIQSTRAGADFGFGLIWALILVHICKYPFFQFGTRYASATGESLLHGYHKLGKRVLIAYIFLNAASMFTIQAAVTIVTAGLAANLFGLTTNIIMWSGIITLIAFLILVIGKYKMLDTVMKIIIIVLTISTVVAVSFAIQNHSISPNFAQVLPKTATEIAFLIAFLGWMPAPLDVSIWQSLWTLEKKKISNKKYTTKQAIFDFNIGYLSTLILGVCFLSLGALIMFNSGISFSNSALSFSKQLIELYTTSIGKEAQILISIAAFTTMFSTTLTTLDASPRAMTTSFEILRGQSTQHGYWYWIVFLALGTLIILGFFLSEMGLLIKIATILSFITAPFYAIINYILITSKHTPIQWHPSIGLKIMSWTGIIFLIGFSSWYLSSLLN